MAPLPATPVPQAILTQHLAKLPGADIRELMGDKLTLVTLELYNFICDKLPPTPSRFHYVFNLRDLSRLYEGLLLSTPDKCKCVSTHATAVRPCSAAAVQPCHCFPALSRLQRALA